MKLITVSGMEPIPLKIIVEYLTKTNVEFYIYRAIYDAEKAWDFERYDYKDIETVELSDWEDIIVNKDLGHTLTYKDIHNNSDEFILEDVKTDPLFIEIVEKNTSHSGCLEVHEVEKGSIYRIKTEHDCFNDEMYSVIEIFNKDDWNIAE